MRKVKNLKRGPMTKSSFDASSELLNFHRKATKERFDTDQLSEAMNQGFVQRGNFRVRLVEVSTGIIIEKNIIN